MTGITNGQVISAFRDLVADKAQISQSSGWSPRLIYFYLIRYRARLIREKIRKMLKVSHWNYQTIDCIPLQRADIDECPCTPASGCEFRKTATQIPKPLDRLKSVTSTDGRTTYTYVEWERLKHKINSRFRGERRTSYYTLKTRQNGTYLYLYSNTNTSSRYVTITGIFENPLEVQYYPGCDGKEVLCKDPMNEEFIVDPDVLPVIYDLALRQLLAAKQIHTDILNNDKDDISASNQTKVSNDVQKR